MGDDVERPQRFDLVAVEFDADRAIPIGREEVDDAAAASECARALDCIGGPPAARTEPVGQFLGVEPPPRLQPPRALLDFARVRQGGSKA